MDKIGEVLSNMGPNALYGLEVTAIGMIVVFTGLVILIALVKLMTTIGDRSAAKKAQAAAEEAEAARRRATPAKAAEPAPAPVEVTEPEPEQADDGEIVAAIMAALSIVYEGTGKRPVVRNVRRSSKGWSKAYN